MIITISGTPGTGKTVLAKTLAKQRFTYFDLNAYIKQEKLYDSYDRKAKTYDVHILKLAPQLNKKYQAYVYHPKNKQEISAKKILDQMIKYSKTKKISTTQFLSTLNKIKLNPEQNIIIDSHLSHYLKADYCIVLRINPEILYTRLHKRKYSKQKISDNITAEIFNACEEEAQALNRKVLILQS